MKSSTCFCRLVSAIETPCHHCGRTKSENQAKLWHKVQIRRRWWDGPPGPRGTPSSRIPNNDISTLQCVSRPTGASAADQGVRPTSKADLSVADKAMWHFSVAHSLISLAGIAERSCRALPGRGGTPYQIGRGAPRGQPHCLLGDHSRQRETLHPDRPRGAASEADQLIGGRCALHELSALFGPQV